MLFISIISLIIASISNRGLFKVSSNTITPKLLSRLTIIFLLYCAAISFNALYLNNIGSGIGIYSGLFQITVTSQSIEVFLYIIGSIILIPWAKSNIISPSKDNKNILCVIPTAPQGPNTIMSGPIVSEYSLIIIFTVLGASLLVSSSDLVSMYLSIELQSFAVYILATIYRDSESATSAGLKYFLLGGLSSCFILLGSGLIYSYTGLTNFESIYSLVSVYPSNFGVINLEGDLNNIFTFTNKISEIYHGYLLGLIFILIGFLFKISAAPFHNWAPDVYDEVPTIVTTWLTIMPKISILIFLLEIQSGLELNFNALSINYGSYDFNVFKNLLLISSLLSLIIGTIIGLAQSRIKRLLAYSTISHVGFILLALGVNTEESIESFLFYIVQYTITNLNTFLILLAFGYSIFNFTDINNYNLKKLNNKKSFEESTLLRENKSDLNRSSIIAKGLNIPQDINLINELKGQFFSNPLLSISLAICLFSMAGIPPLIGFFSKQMVLLAAIQSGYYFLSIVAIIVSVISASYYLKIIKVLHFESPDITSTLNSANNKKKEGSAPAPQAGEKMENLNSNPVTASFTLSRSSLNNSSKAEMDYPKTEQKNTKVGSILSENIYVGSSKGEIQNSHSFIISSLTLIILLFIIKPSLLLNSTHLLALNIFTS